MTAQGPQRPEHPQVRTARLKLEEPAVATKRMAAWRRRARAIVRRLSGQPTASMPNGVVLWDGPSELTGEPVALVAVGFRMATNNPKTGDLVQTYVVPQAESPHAAARAGRDGAVCGTCPQRPSVGGSCYVTTQWAPSRVWESAMGARYVRITVDGGAALLAGADVRLGTWGDPVAVPLEVWEALLAEVHGWSGYTHQWRTAEPVERWARLVMASCDSPLDRRRAAARGWRTFRVDWTGTGPGAGERVCLAEAHKVPCIACRGCDGTSRGAGRDSYVITPHGYRTEGGKAKKGAKWGRR